MLNIQFDFDEDGLAASSDAYVDDVLQPALLEAVNRTAARVARGLGGYVKENLHRASAFTLQAGGCLPTREDDAHAALVFVRRR